MSLDRLMEIESERNKIQKMLDDFCELTGLAAVVNDASGNKLSELVNVSAYCQEMRAKDGLCCLSDHKGATVAVSIGETCIYICHAGVVDFAIPLIVDGTYIGSIMAGQVRTEEKLPFDFTSEATKEWMADKALYHKYLMLPVMDKEQIQRSAKVLEIMRSYIVQRIENLRRESSNTRVDDTFIMTQGIDKLKAVIEAIERLDYQAGKDRLLNLTQQLRQADNYQLHKQVLEQFKAQVSARTLGIKIETYHETYDDYNNLSSHRLEDQLVAFYDWVFEQVLDRKYIRAKDELDYAVAYIQRYYYKKLTAGQVAEYMNLSPDYFSRRFKQRFGLSYSEYLTIHRLKVAKKLLKEKEASIQWIAYSAGFSDAAYFTRVFKKHCLMSPTDYRKHY